MLGEFAASLQGTLVFGIEEDSGGDVIKSFEDLFEGDVAKKGKPSVEPVEDAGRQAFKVGGLKYVSFGASKRLFVVSVADTVTKCFELLDGSLAKRGSVPMPKKLGMTRGPISAGSGEQLAEVVVQHLVADLVLRRWLGNV